MSPSSQLNKQYLRFRWSHRHPVHLFLVKVYNAFMGVLPFHFKYWLGRKLRGSRPPYSLIRGDSVVVQVGAPRDTLRAGRSRGMHFAFLTRGGGRVVIVEPDPDSARFFEETAKSAGLDHVTVCNTAAWSEKTTLKVRMKDTHPAAGFVEDCADYTAEELKQFRTVEMPGDALDNILDSIGVDRVDLVSITTNGAETAILEGLSRRIERDHPFISLARTKDGYPEFMKGLGYETSANDDRGYTFAKSE